MNNLDNKGLEIPIDAIADIVSAYSSTLSRSDVWALAALVSANEAQDDDNVQISFPFDWYGRSDCSSTDGKSSADQSLPSPDLNTHELLEFFSTSFGLSTRETVALMGAHTIGQMSQQNSGFDGGRGWAGNNRNLDNGYFDGLIGGDEDEVTLGQIDDDDTLYRARDWTRQIQDNSNIPNIPNRQFWFNQRDNGRRTIMTSSDIALVRDFSNSMDVETKEVSCSFRGRNTGCPFARETFRIVAEFKFDVDQWIVEFKDVFTKVLLTGYDASGSCDSPPCQLPQSRSNIFA